MEHVSPPGINVRALLYTNTVCIPICMCLGVWLDLGLARWGPEIEGLGGRWGQK